MKNIARLVLLSLIVGFSTTGTHAALSEVSCSTDPDFAANSCNQCFTGGDVSEGDNKGLLTDIWVNNSETDQVLFKEEQEMPQIIGLGGASWTEVKASDSVEFWQYTPALDALYDEDNLGYTLAPGANVTWIESTLGSAYQLLNNPVTAGGNNGILIYDIATHQVEESGDLALDTDIHRECVLYTSGAAPVVDEEPETPVVPETPVLPETGPEHLLLVLAALALGFSFFKFRK